MLLTATNAEDEAISLGRIIELMEKVKEHAKSLSFSKKVGNIAINTTGMKFIVIFSFLVVLKDQCIDSYYYYRSID